MDGTIEDGWPQETDPKQRYSFQSSLLVDLDQNEELEIIGATHGDEPEYYVLRPDGSNFPGWPKAVPENSWTFSTPSLVRIDEQLRFFMSRPIRDSTGDMLYGWNAEGEAIAWFSHSLNPEAWKE